MTKSRVRGQKLKIFVVSVGFNRVSKLHQLMGIGTRCFPIHHIHVCRDMTQPLDPAFAKISLLSSSVY